MRLAGIALPGCFPSDSSPEEEADMHPLSRTPTHGFMLNKTSGGEVDTTGLQLIPCNNMAGPERFSGPLRKSLHRTGKVCGLKCFRS